MDEHWRWIWLVAATGFVVGEAVMPGTFFLLSFAIGAGAASIAAFADGSLAVQWGVFVGVSAVALLVLFPIGRRLDSRQQHASVGATRFAGRRVTVLEEIPMGPHETGTVRMEREEWRAETCDGTPLPRGTVAVVQRVEGTRLILDPTPVGTTPVPETPQE